MQHGCRPPPHCHAEVAASRFPTFIRGPGGMPPHPHPRFPYYTSHVREGKPSRIGSFGPLPLTDSSTHTYPRDPPRCCRYPTGGFVGILYCLFSGPRQEGGPTPHSAGGVPAPMPRVQAIIAVGRASASPARHSVGVPPTGVPISHLGFAPGSQAQYRSFPIPSIALGVLSFWVL